MMNFKKSMKRVISVLLLVCILASALMMQSCKKTTYDYMDMKLSKYIKLDKSAYTNYTVTVDIPETSKNDINDAFIQSLFKGKDKNENVYAVQNHTIGVGDTANIFYRGYVVEKDEEGNDVKNYFDGGCNFTTGIASLEIGAGQFVSGFEYNLIGHNRADYATLDVIEDGFLMKGDVITLTYSVMYADGKADVAKTATVNLSDSDLDASFVGGNEEAGYIYGEGFKEYFNDTKIEIGKVFAQKETDNKGALVTTTKDGDNVFFDLKVEKAYRINTEKKSDVLEVEAYFPYNYNNEDLQCKTAIFEVFIRTVEDYTIPEFNESFITDTLELELSDVTKYTEADINSLGALIEGDTLLEKQYKAYLKDKLDEQRESAVNSVIEEAFWTIAMEKAVFKKLPEHDVDRYYKDNYNTIKSTYESNTNYQSQYSTLDSFARAYMGITDATADWKQVLRTDSEEAVKQKLIFYYVIREEGFIPSNSEAAALREKLYNETVENYLINNGTKKSDADYQDKLASAKETVSSTYDDKYWENLVIYTYGIEQIRALASVTDNIK